MAHNLTTLRGTPAYTAGKFGNALSGGVLSTASNTEWDSAVGTIEAWVKTTATSTRVAVGNNGSSGNSIWLGIDTGGVLSYGTPNTIASSTLNIADGAWHHIALTIDGVDTKLWADGAVRAVTTPGFGGITNWPSLTMGAGTNGIGGFGAATGFDWVGQIDDVRISSSVRYTGTTYTVPAAPFSDDFSDTAATAIYHFESSGADTARTAAVTFNPNDTGILYSPGNWSVSSGLAETINAGAYLKTLIAGSTTTLGLTFDMTNVSSPVPQIAYRIDEGAWIVTPIAATVTLTMPTGNTWTKHSLEVVVKSTSQTLNRWNSPRNTAVKLTGIVTNSATATASKPTERALRVMVFGDSITEGIYTINSTATSDTDRHDARQGWAWQLGDALGAEVGVVGFGGQGLSGGGVGNVPALSTSYSSLWSGTARTFPTLDLIVVNIGTNDASTNTTTAMTSLLNGLLSATAARIVVLRPFNGTAQATFLQAAVAACSDPKRVTYVDTAGWWSSTDSADSLHPYGYANVTKLAPLVASAARSALARGATWINVGGVAKAATIVRR